MPSVPQFVTRAFERLLFRPATVVAISEPASRFRLIDFAGPLLRGIMWVPGQKVQVHLGRMISRTYTPLNWNADEGRMQILAYLHGNGPGSEWAASLSIGETCHLFGPRGSIAFPEIGDPIIFFGDETAIGAAFALTGTRRTPDRAVFVFEASSVEETGRVVAHLNLPGVQVVQRKPLDEHLHEVAALLEQKCSSQHPPYWLFAGRAQSIQTVRTFLNARNVPLSLWKAKAYWADGKTGLD